MTRKNLDACINNKYTNKLGVRFLFVIGAEELGLQKIWAENICMNSLGAHSGCNQMTKNQ